MKHRTITHALLLLFVFCFPSLAFAQEPTEENFSKFMDRRIRLNVQSRIDQTDPTKQAEPPAAAANSTSLVERSSAPDLLGFGLDFLNLSDSAAGDKKSATPKTMTFSAYALKSALSSQDPLDPQIYNRDRKWRSVSFTLGYEVPENSNTRDPVFGIKWLAHNGRDVSNDKNLAEIKKIQTALDAASQGSAAIADEARIFLFTALKKRGLLTELKRDGKLITDITTQEDFEGALADQKVFPVIRDSLTAEEKNTIDQIILKHLRAFINLNRVTKSVVDTIRSRPQLALEFVTKQRKGSRPDEYSAMLTFDKGMGTSSITLNGSFMFNNNRTGRDSRGGKFAAAFHLPLQAFRPLGYSDPLQLSLEADATSMTNMTPMYRGQAKLTIPIALLPGMEIPISVSVANRTEFVKEKEVKGKFGFTFDLSKTLKAFRDTFQRIE
jgi:hypothetical protein